MLGGTHETLEIHPARLAQGAGRGRPGDGGSAAPDHLGHDRLAGRRGPAHQARPVRLCARSFGRDPTRDRRAHGGPRQVHGPAHLRAGSPRPLLPDGHGAEQLLMSAAAGMAREGFQPWATTYAVFAARRAYDFICMAIAEENLNVKIVCALPGLTTGYGPSHQATEDLAIFRGLPNMTLIDPCDAHEIEQIVPAIADHDGPVYMRLLRGNVPLILDKYDYTFELGKAKLLRDGKDALIISTGFMTMRALEADETLGDDRVDVGVLHVPTIKPLDEATILREAARTGRMVVVAENHTVVGGLGEAVAGLLLRSGVTPKFQQVGLPDEFLDAGALPTLHERYGISANAMSRQIKKWLSH